jgi:glycosyltransferase involved in cell wall biosynthesis
MTNADGQEHLLLYEPRAEGHHPGWLRFISDDLLSAGMRLTLAVDMRPQSIGRIRDHLGPVASDVAMMNVHDFPGAGAKYGGKILNVADCLRHSGAENVFLCAFDETASDLWRRAALGVAPPKELRARMGGIYHRPRFLERPRWTSPGWFKMRGFRRFLREGWLRQLLFLNEYLVRELQDKFPGAPFHFLCDPCPPFAPVDAADARAQLQVPPDAKVFLFYGGGYRRKGLHLAVEAMSLLSADSPAYLLCAGQLNPDPQTAAALEKLVGAGQARFINRFVTADEEAMAFAASDAVLLPYIHHIGTSGILSRAASAGKMVIVSDEELIGRLTREYGMGLLFPTENVKALSGCIQSAATMPLAQRADFATAVSKYAAIYSREAFRKSLVKAVRGKADDSK